mmetsp:Transcript_40957/g.162168  ORF Transcript_40957/g.162168 Transcript_40957/m.162168 type:complete len:206 (+) Transcript_40957:2311-2928(+)
MVPKSGEQAVHTHPREFTASITIIVSLMCGISAATISPHFSPSTSRQYPATAFTSAYSSLKDNERHRLRSSRYDAIAVWSDRFCRRFSATQSFIPSNQTTLTSSGLERSSVPGPTTFSISPWLFKSRNSTTSFQNSSLLLTDQRCNVSYSVNSCPLLFSASAQNLANALRVRDLSSGSHKTSCSSSFTSAILLHLNGLDSPMLRS